MPFPIHYPAIDAVALAVVSLLAALAFGAVCNRFKQRLLGTCFRTAGLQAVPCPRCSYCRWSYRLHLYRHQMPAQGQHVCRPGNHNARLV